MYKNQLQELAQRSCFNLPWYTCVREGPDHAPRFKAVVSFNGENFESPQYCSTLRQAEHTAAEAALVSLSSRHSLAARMLDETGVYKNLMQEIAQRVGSPLPQYTTYRSGSGHLPVFTGTVELAGITFTGDPAKNKKQAEKNAALAAWLSLKQLAQQDASSSSEHENNDEQEQIRIARALQNYCLKEKIGTANRNTFPITFQKKISFPTPRPPSPQRPPMCTSKILPLFRQNTTHKNPPPSSTNDTSDGTLSQRSPSLRPPSPDIPKVLTQRFPATGAVPSSSRPPSPDTPKVQLQRSVTGAVPSSSQPPSSDIPKVHIQRFPITGAVPSSTQPPSPDIPNLHVQRFPVTGAASYLPIRQCRSPYQGIAPPVTLRTSTPVFAAPPRPRPVQVMQPPSVQSAPPVRIRQAIPVFTASPSRKEDATAVSVASQLSNKLLVPEKEEIAKDSETSVDESIAVKCVEQLEI